MGSRVRSCCFWPHRSGGGFGSGPLPRRSSSRLSLELAQAASVCPARGRLTWRSVCSEGLVPEGHGLHGWTFKDVLVGCFRVVIAWGQEKKSSQVLVFFSRHRGDIPRRGSSEELQNCQFSGSSSCPVLEDTGSTEGDFSAPRSFVLPCCPSCQPPACATFFLDSGSLPTARGPCPQPMVLAHSPWSMAGLLLRGRLWLPTFMACSPARPGQKWGAVVLLG